MSVQASTETVGSIHMDLSDKTLRRVYLLLSILIYSVFVFYWGIDARWPEETVDLPSFYFAAQYAFEYGLSPYEPNTLLSATGFLGGQYVYPFLYSPVSLLAFFPLAHVSYRTAEISMLVVNHLCVLFFLYFFVTKLLKVRLTSLPFVLSLYYITHFYPIVVTMNYGQVNLVIICLLCVTWYGLKHKWHPAIAMLPLAIAIAVKSSPGVFLFYLVVRKKFRELLYTLLFLACFFLIAAVVIPYDVWQGYWTYIVPNLSYGKSPVNLFSIAAHYNQSFNGFFGRIFLLNRFVVALYPDAFLAWFMPFMASALLVGVTCLLSFLANFRTKHDLMDYQFCLFLCAMFLASPLSWESNLVFVLPVFLYGLVHFLKEDSGFWKLVLFALVALTPALYHAYTEIVSWPMAFFISLKMYSVLIMWFYFAILMWKVVKPRDLPAEE